MAFRSSKDDEITPGTVREFQVKQAIALANVAASSMPSQYCLHRGAAGPSVMEENY